MEIVSCPGKSRQFTCSQLYFSYRTAKFLWSLLRNRNWKQRQLCYGNCVAWKRSRRTRILSLKEFLFGDVWSTGTISIYDAKWTRNFLCANRSYRRETDRTSLFPPRIFSSFSLLGGNVMRKQDKLSSRTAIEASSIQTKLRKRIPPSFFDETIVVGYLRSYFSTKRKSWREKNFNEDPSIDMIMELARKSRGRRAWSN